MERTPLLAFHHIPQLIGNAEPGLLLLCRRNVFFTIHTEPTNGIFRRHFLEVEKEEPPDAMRERESQLYKYIE